MKWVAVQSHGFPAALDVDILREIQVFDPEVAFACLPVQKSQSGPNDGKIRHRKHRKQPPEVEEEESSEAKRRSLELDLYKGKQDIKHAEAEESQLAVYVRDSKEEEDEEKKQQTEFWKPIRERIETYRQMITGKIQDWWDKQPHASYEHSEFSKLLTKHITNGLFMGMWPRCCSANTRIISTSHKRKSRRSWETACIKR
jgi:hypothetical protein